MFSPTLFLAFLAAHSTLIAAGPFPATDSGAQQPPGGDVQPQSGSNLTAAEPLYVITSAYIHQYDVIPTANKTVKARQATDEGSAVNSTVSDSVGSEQPNAGLRYPANPITMEDFNITIVPAAGNGAAVHCNATWNADTANSGTRDHIANTPFSCDDRDHKTLVRMERRNVTPLYGFYIFVKMPGIPEATWMVGDLNGDESKKAGWTVRYPGGDMAFKGAAHLTQGAPPALADFLQVPT